jgi:hypothetical protein
VLFIFRSLYLCAIGLWPVFSFRRNLPPILSCIPKQLDSSRELYIEIDGPVTNGILTLSDVLFQGTWTGVIFKASSADYNSDPLTGPDFKSELLPLHSPLLGQSLLVSCPPLIDMLKFSGCPYLIRGQILIYQHEKCGRKRWKVIPLSLELDRKD